VPLAHSPLGRHMSDILVLQVVVIACGTVLIVTSTRVLTRYLERRRRSPSSSDAAALGLAERLQRIEQTVEATAIEVERISEANRFMAKLLAERSAPAVPASRPERVITPH
jgi:hypothetical protein